MSQHATYTLTRTTAPKPVRAHIAYTSRRTGKLCLRPHGYIDTGKPCYAITATVTRSDGATWPYTDYFRQEKHARAWYDLITGANP